MINVYNQQLKLIAVLENAYAISYEKVWNEIWSAGFSLPLDDKKNEYCQPLNYVEIIDDTSGENIGLFRIIPSLSVRNESRNEVTYTCNHVLSTLMDDVLFQYHQVTNLTTRESIEYILDQQTIKRWKLGRCDFTRYFHYGWESENGLAGPLFSITEPFDEPFQWTWDTSTYPWTLNLIKPSSNVTCEIRYGKNLVEIERNVDPSNIVNRIYPLGFGEGVNQLTIEKVNNGKKYLEDTESITKYGVLSYVWVDRRFEYADSLKGNAAALLKQWKDPKVTYRVNAADLSSLTDSPIDELRLGKVVRIVDPDFGTIETRIVSESKSDITGAPGSIDLEISNKSDDLTTVNVDIERRQQINESYAQGATNIDTYSFQDNADANNPAVIEFYVPNELVNINKLELSFRTSEFRAYSQATEGGGGLVESTSAGGALVKSTQSGGGTSKSTESGGGSTQTSSAGGASTQTSSAGGGTTQSSSAGGDHRHRVFRYTGDTPDTGDDLRIYSAVSNLDGSGAVSIAARGGATNVYTDTSSGDHTHTVTIPNHTHTVNIPAHTHQVSIPSHSHEFTIPAHTHEMDIPSHTHDVNIPNHSHELKFGIYKLSTSPSSVTIKVDGNVVPFTGTSGDNIDLIPYLGTDSEGKITRGQWHTVEITPNGLGRITANIVNQFFVKSRGGVKV